MQKTTIRWGVIGAGDVFEHKSGPALYQTPHSELVAVMRTDAAKAETTAARHGAARWYTDAAALVNDPDVNAVYIASPHYLHPEHVALAARAGKDILCEKPMGVSAAQAQQCVDLCRTHGVMLTVAYYRRFWRVTRAIRTYMQDGAIGEIIAARFQVTDFFAATDERAWLSSRAKTGGDALANTGAHWVDLTRYLLGEVHDVMAYCSSKFGGLDTDETNLTQMQMASGALAALFVTRRTPIATNEIDIFGTGGRLYASPLSGGQLLLHRNGRDPERMQFPRAGVNHGELLAELVPCLLASDCSPLPGEEAVAVWRIMEAAYQSAAEGTRVAVRPVETKPREQ